MNFFRRFLNLIAPKPKPVSTDSLVMQAVKSVVPNPAGVYRIGWERCSEEAFARIAAHADAGDIEALATRPEEKYVHDFLVSYLVLLPDGLPSLLILVDPFEYLMDPYVVYQRHGVALPESTVRALAVPENMSK